MASKTSLTDFASTISTNASILEDFFQSNHAIPRPSFSADGPIAFPCPPEATHVHQAREAMLDAAKKLYQLALGPVESLFELALRCHDSASLHTIYRFNIAGQVPLDGEASFADIAKAISVDEDRVRRILRLAMCIGLFKETRPGFVSHTGMSALMAQNTMSVNAVVGHVMDDIYPASCKVADSIERYPMPNDRLVETPFALAFDANEPFFNYINKHPHRVNRFHEAMKALNNSGPCSGEVMAKGYDWSEWKDGSLVDVGGSTGHTTLKIAENSDIAKFTVQDFSADEVSKSQSALAKQHQGRVTFMQHDFFNPQPIKDADAYFFRLIFHDWPDQECIKILQNHVPAMKNGASILVCDLLLPEPNTVPTRIEKEMRNSDLHMLCLNGSCERDIGAWERLFAQADARFKLVGAKQPQGQALSIVQARWEELVN